MKTNMSRVLFGIVFILLAIYFGGNRANKVYAASALDKATYTDYAFKTYTGTEAKEYVGKKVPAEEEGYVFAGWYTAATCKVEEAVKTNASVQSSDSVTYYAKYVPEEVLSIRVQVSTKEDVNPEVDGNQRNMRVVSSVDTLNYSKVGFRLKYREDNIESNSWIYKKNTAEIVYERIQSATEGDEYKFSPKVVNTKSQYFMTATWKGDDNTGISEADFDTNYYIRAYWVTLDGMTVYGPTRYVSVNDGLHTNIVNMSVKNSTWTKTSTLTTDAYAGASVSVAYQDGAYAHLKVDLGAGVNRANVLKSVTKFTITDGSAEEEVIYRNLYTKYSGEGTEDRSWLTVIGTNKGEYVIATSADLFGLASIVNASTDKDYRYYFGGQKIYLVADIEVNKGRATANAWSTTDEEGNAIQDATSNPCQWTPIGLSSVQTLLGVFDGQGHTISGLVSTDSRANKGMFAYTGADTKIRNFRLTKSLFKNDQGWNGSIVGISYGGEIDNVYSDAYVTSSNVVNGGIVGVHWSTTSCTIKNTCYAGTMTVTSTNTGGIVGKILKGTLDIDNCLFSGDISYSGVTGNILTGGFVGYSVMGLTIKNSLNSGRLINADDATVATVGRVLGRNDASIMLEDVYVTNVGDNTAFWYNPGGLAQDSEDPVMLEETDITGNLAYFNKILDYSDSGAWAVVMEEHAKEGAIVVDSTPVLKEFADIAGVEVKLPTLPEGTDVAWYNGLEVDTHTVCNNADDNDANVAQLYGFAYLVNKGIDFDKMTVNLGADVIVNADAPTTSEAWTTYLTENTDVKKWTPIGTTNMEFAGTFNGKTSDGVIHTIKGLYVDITGQGAGLFRRTAEGSTIQNLKIENSYINSTYTSNWTFVGSVAGSCGGELKNIYSNAVVKAKKSIAGGLVGEMHGSEAMSMDNCWFAGSVTGEGSLGGMTGVVTQGRVTMKNCLNSGTISGTANSIGGLCGRTFRSTAKFAMDGNAVTSHGLSIHNSLNTGTVKYTTGATDTTGSILGWVQHITEETGGITISKVYTTNESCNANNVAKMIGKNGTKLTITLPIAVSESNITGNLAYFNKILDYSDTGAWAVVMEEHAKGGATVVDSTPVLKEFADIAGVEVKLPTLPEGTDVAWYNGLEVDTHTVCNNADDNNANVAELYGFAYLVNKGIDFDGKTVYLANDVTVNDINLNPNDKIYTTGESNWDDAVASARVWTPIGSFNQPFAGTFDGKLPETTEVHTISGLYKTASSAGLGLFVATAEGSAIQNLKLENSYFVNIANYTGSIAAQCAGDITNVYSNATVQGKHYNGGIVGYVPVASEKTVDIKKCWFDGNLKASGNQTGGIVGGIEGAGQLTIENCLNSGTLAGTAGKLTFAGGLCGYAIDTNITIDKCLNVGTVDGGTATSGIGSIFGNKNTNAVVTVTDTYTTAESYSYKDVATAFGNTAIADTGYCICSTSDITGAKGYYNIDFARGDVWAITATTPELEAFSTAKIDDPDLTGKNIDWYTGLVDSKFTICAETDENTTKVDKLYGFAFLVDQGINFKGKTVNLGQDVTVNEGTVYDDWDKENGTYNGVALTTWNPIGEEGKVFAGTFDGNSKTIKGIYVKGTTFLGLFARVDTTGNINNLTLEDSYFEGTGSMGSIAGRMDGNIDTVYSSADIKSSGANNGGIVGQKNSSTKNTITNCCYAGTITMGTAASNTGGILGKQINGDLTLQDCLFEGHIEVNSDKNRTANIGGFVGHACKQLTINTSLSSGSITNDSGYSVYATCPVIGQIENSNKNDVIITCDSVYYTEEGYTTTNAWYRSYATVDGEKVYYSVVKGMDPVLVAKTDIAGEKAFYYTNLNFEAEKGWALVTEAVNGADGTPVLKSFVDASEIPALPEVPENVDIKWFKGLGVNTYTICNSETDNAANVKELYGFEYLVNDMGIDFSGKTVFMLNDVTVNEGWTATETPEVPANTWTPMGTDAKPFAGTFNGNGNTIDGLYVDGSHDYAGFFATTGYYSTIQDFRIVNSYFNQQITSNTNAGFTGSVAGELRGKMSGVYSNAIVKSGNNCIAGLVARVKTNSGFTTKIDISNCWFDGKIYAGETGRYIGGIVGTAVRGTCNIENVLFTGRIESDFMDLENSVYIAGIVADGKANSLNLNLTSVVSAGQIVGNHNFGVVHSVIGRVRQRADQNPTLTCSNVFATRDCCETTYSVGSDETLPAVTVTGAVLQTTGDDRLIGYGTLENTDSALTFGKTAWSMRTDGVPVPTSLKDMATNVIESPDAAAMAAEIGLTYWKADATIKDAKASGGGDYLVSYAATDNAYAEYIDMLTKSVEQGGLGFTLYADNSGKNDTISDMNADGVYSSTYYKAATATTGEWVLNITYVKKESKIYISINTDLESRDDNLISAEQVGSDVISLSMLEMVNTHDENPYGNSFVFELPNGHFIVNDGGRAEDGEKLLVFLKDQAGTTNGVQNPVYIDAWIISHYHDDHCGALGGFYDDGELNTYDVLSGSELREDIYLKAVYACEPTSYALDYWDMQLGVMNKALKGAMTLTQAPAAEGETPKQPEVYQLHMGQRYYFNGITMDVIDTQEQHPLDTWGKDSDGNDLPDAFNTSSTNCLFTFKDANNATKKVLIGGDATTVNMEYIMDVYRTDNKVLSNIDVFVAYHHGHNTTATYTEGTVSATYESSSVTANIQGTATYDWVNFLLDNNDDNKFDAVLFPFNQIYEMSLTYSGSATFGGRTYYYKGVDGNVTYPYNIGEINNYMSSSRNSTVAYSYGNGTVKIAFDGNNTAKVFGKGIFTE